MISSHNKKNTSGLVRIVMINSGQADYVEIEPGSSVHLVGDNGVGKSMILATLQFLLIDDWSRGKMKFSSGPLKHKEFYFPNSSSYVIFELESTEGIRNLYIIRGLGKTNSFEIEKWGAEGCWYNEDIFIDSQPEGVKTRSWDEIRDNLMRDSTSLVKISNNRERIRLLRAWLGWYENPKNESNFSKLYLQFLKLGSVKESFLKDHIISTSVPENMTTRIDITERYYRIWRDIVDERSNLINLKSVETKLSALILEYDQLSNRKGNLSQRFGDMIENVQDWMENFEDKEKELGKELDILGNKNIEITSSIEDDSKILRELSEQRLILQLEIKQLVKIETFAKNFSKSDSDTIIENLENNLERIAALLGSAEENSIDSINDEIIITKEKERKLIDFIKGSSNLLSSLRDNGIDDTTIKNAFKILDRELLLNRGEVVQKKIAKEWMSSLSNSLENNLAEVNGIQVEITRNEPELIDTASAIVDLEKMEGKIKKLNQQLKDRENKEPLILEKAKILRDFVENTNNRNKYDNWVNLDKQVLSDSVIKLGEVDDEFSRIEIKIKVSKELKKDNDDEISNIETQIKEISDSNSIIQSFKDCLVLLNLDGVPKNTAEKYESIDLVKDVKQLHTDCNDYQTDELRFQPKLVKIQASLGYVVSGIDEKDFITEAREKLESIEQSQENLEDLWFQLSNNISTTAVDLTKSLREVERKVNEITSQLKKKKITSLDGIRITINKNETKVMSIIEAANTNELSNFESRQNRTHFKQMEKLFNEKPSIELVELFDLDFHIKKPGYDEWQKISSIDTSGSGGTKTTIKTHLMMILMSDILGSNRSRLPVFLDETGTLGPNNYKQILDMAKETEMQIMTASPSAVQFAEKQHPVVGYGERERLRIRPKQSWSSISNEGE